MTDNDDVDETAHILNQLHSVTFSSSKEMQDDSCDICPPSWGTIVLFIRRGGFIVPRYSFLSIDGRDENEYCYCLLGKGMNKSLSKTILYFQF